MQIQMTMYRFNEDKSEIVKLTVELRTPSSKQNLLWRLCLSRFHYVKVQTAFCLVLFGGMEGRKLQSM